MSLIDKLNKNNKDPEEIGKAVISIVFGTFIGCLTYALSFRFHIDIFGWNLAFVFAPLFAGYAETYLSIKLMDETTGAISAYLLFFVTVIHGFILANPTLGVNGITVGAIIVILQAAFPTLINYFFLVVVIGSVSYLFGFFKQWTDKLYYTIVPIFYKLIGREFVPKRAALTVDNFATNLEETNINDLGVLFMTTTHPWQVNVKEYIGVFEGSVIIPNENRFFEIKTKNEENLLLIRFQEAKDQALKQLAKEIKDHGGNGVLDLEIEYNIVGELIGDSFHIVAKGTGVLLE
ncbi:hypothetical protein [uncultured Methanobrevibacter sp.]|uniref:hypothetical protein n=1 Tax=uncultured Methanobrevibacter sp. TaxID=253161 RepID=UPI00258531E6|nr:hypothetical protein [uncultured Methanobrevibacter sp.]